MKENVLEKVKKCDNYQSHPFIVNAPILELQNVPQPIAFPQEVEGRKFLIVAINYFTKYNENHLSM